ncbi:FecR family protein [Echinicola shivajiensis]|uniref:FecR family protein n=1 Tax=Echinicola shivajiensis TaxID=1035916 RepID=UPI001BFC1746|nr:FecR domain-containing protein [Echinicola shivajiensis]
MIKEEFLKLVEKHRQGTATASEVKLVEKFYDNMQYHATLEDIESIVSEEKGHQLFDAIITKLSDRKQINNRPIWPIFKVAAALLLIMVMAVTIKHIAENRNITVSTAIGEQMEVLLNDGSTVTLSENSRLTYPRSFRNAREVNLEGRAFFDIKRDISSPFLVHTENADIKVLGTSFDVNCQSPEATTVSVITGKVQVSPLKHPEEAVVISRNQQLTSSSTQLLAISSFRSQEPISWTKLIVLKNTSLGEAAEMLENRFGIKIKFESKALKEQRISGKFKNETIDNILKSIAMLKQFSYEFQNENTIYIKKK